MADVPDGTKFEFSFLGNDRRPSQKSGTRRENRNAPDSPDLSLSIPDDRGYLRFRVFIGRQNLGQSGNSKIQDRLGFSRHMKTRLWRFYCFPTVPDFANKWKLEIVDIPNRLGWTGTINSGESGAFLFSRRVPDFCVGRRPFPTNETSNLYRLGRRRWVSLITNPLNCWVPVPLSKINMASLENTEMVVFPIRKLKDWDLESPACKVSQCYD